MKRSSLHRVQRSQKGRYASGRSPCASTRNLHRRRSWRTRSMAAFVMRGRLLMGAAVVGNSMPSRGVHQVVPQVVPQIRVVIVQDKTLPPVLQRIAQCESHGQPWTTDGTIPARHTAPPRCWSTRRLESCARSGSLAMRCLRWLWMCARTARRLNKVQLAKCLKQWLLILPMQDCLQWLHHLA
jgi:hypothetical protein